MSQTPLQTPGGESPDSRQELFDLWRDRIAALNPAERKLLFALALHRDPVAFSDLRYAAYNPFRLEPPAEPQSLPALPELRPYPWGEPPGSPQPSDPSPAERAQWRVRLQQARREREAAFVQLEDEHRAKDEHIERTRNLSRTIFSLSDQGLIETAESQATYSVHPKIRERALAIAEACYPADLAELKQELVRAYIPFRPPGESGASRADLQPWINRVRLLSAAGRYADAAREYQNRLNTGLFDHGEWALMIELLEPLLPAIDEKGFDPALARYVLTELGNAHSIRHNPQRALACYARALDPHYLTNSSGFANAMSNYGRCLVENGRLAQAERAFALALDWGDDSDRLWVRLRRIRLAMLVGDREAATSHLQACWDGRPYSQFRRVWQARLALAEARVALANADPAAEQQLQQALQQSTVPGAMIAAQSYSHLARLYLGQSRYTEAAGAVEQADKVAERDGVSRAMLLGLHARIMHGLGRQTEARRMIATALHQAAQSDVGEQAQLMADAAELYLAWDAADSAAQYVRRGLALAWPAGEPQPFAQPFRQLEPLIAALGVDWQPAPAHDSEPLPFEQEITANVQQARTLSKANPHQQSTFYIGGFEWMQIGTVACFGVTDERLMRRVAEKLARLSWRPQKLTISRMGEEVPPPWLPPDGERIIAVGERREFAELRFSHEEELLFDRFFVIIGVVGRNADDELVHAYVNCRVDRLHTLLQADNSAQPFDIADYATLVTAGIGLPDAATREKLQRDYLFGEQTTTVRIFPPLSEVT